MGLLKFIGWLATNAVALAAACVIFDGIGFTGSSGWNEVTDNLWGLLFVALILGIVNSFIALFKDTTLVLIIGLFDFLGMIQAALTDPAWLGFATEGYVFAAFVYWVFCFSISRYSQTLERRV